MANCIGIDIGKCAVKVILIEHQKNSRIRQAFKFPFPLKQGSQSEIDFDVLKEELLSRLPLKDWQNSKVAVNIPSAEVNALVLTLPKIRNPKELATAAVAEAKRKMVPTPGPESIFESLVVGETLVGKVSRHEVLVIKTEKKFVDSILNFFNHLAGIHPVLISPTGSTIVNDFSDKSPVLSEDTAFIDLGYETLDISITKNGVIYFSRNVKFGVKDIISRISASLSFSREKAEKLIMDKGVPEIDSELDLNDKVQVAEEIMRQKYETSLLGPSGNEVIPLELRVLWNTEIERIIHEIRRTLIFYKEQSQGRRVEHIFFFGGGAQIKGLVPEVLKKIRGNHIRALSSLDLGLETDAGAALEFDENQFIYSSALSLAQSIAFDKKRNNVISFLPLSLKRKDIILRRQWAGMICGTFLIAVLALSWLRLKIDTVNCIRRNSSLSLEMKRTEKIRDKLELMKKKKNRIFAQYDEVDKLESGRLDMPEVLSVLNSCVPAQVTLSSCYLGPDEKAVSGSKSDSQSKRRRTKKSASEPEAEPPSDKYVLKVTALCVSDYEQALVWASDFRQALQDSPFFAKVSIIWPELEKVSPDVLAENKVSLTENILRTFSLKADIAENKK